MIAYDKFDDTLLVSVCERFLEGDSVMEIVEWTQREHGVSLKRENIYPLLREARRRGYFSIFPPPHGHLQQRVCDRFNARKEHVNVVRVRGETARHYVAAAAAEYLVQLVHLVGERKHSVHIGFGGGGTIMLVARALAFRLHLEGSLPRLGLHAVTSGFDVTNPWTAPVSFFGYFDQAAPHVDYVGLFAPAVVEAEDYEHVKTLPGVEESFRRAREIDIVVTSLASAGDPHGELNRFMSLGKQGSNHVAELKEAGWIGDVTYRPYSESGPISASEGIRAVCLFELERLVEFAQEPNKHVVLVAAPCGVCQQSKGDALHPLLAEPKLKLWTDLFMDLTTTQTVLPRED